MPIEPLTYLAGALCVGASVGAFFAVALWLPARDWPPVRRCRACGCTQERACQSTSNGSMCRWVAHDLCSACNDRPGRSDLGWH